MISEIGNIKKIPELLQYLDPIDQLFNDICSAHKCSNKGVQSAIRAIEDDLMDLNNNLYTYTGALDLTNQTGYDLLALLVAAEELIILQLIYYVQKYIIDNESSWLLTNLVNVLHTVFKLQSCNIIQDFIMDIICMDPNVLFELEDFPTVDKDILLRIIKKNDLDSQEINIWKHLVKWGTVQLATSLGKKTIEFDIKKWNENDFITFKKLLDPFLPYIRFYEISCEDFYYYVRPYKKVLSENHYEDLVAYLMANAKPQYSKLLPRHGNVYIDSDIIESEHSVIISSWIEKKYEKLSCKFILAYRGTRDGFDSNISYYMCETIIAILVLIKIKDSNKIIGGFNPLGWNLISHGYYGSDCFEDECFEEEHWTSTNDSFIFCFDEYFNTHILSHVENPEKAIYNNSCANESWLNFGGGDLVFRDQRGTCSKCNYEKSILEDYIFIAEEVEIFQVQMPKVQKKSHNMEIERKSKRAKLNR
ncbi:hypothetical protein C2G38_2047996 [Gigaspora rosea]|uniref:TLDc domain-containing protein n=1 Tax=Gigaspora rosea TaxID=44941 RepID=A0A397U452_9GLOM|nr:hypothetical protein C2G38_2047996 [Gigaspora rosea]